MRIIVTAGPTREFIDPVRFISNRSTGKMGYAIAASCAKRGHDVVLISGPVCLDPPDDVKVTKVVSAKDMCDAVTAEFSHCDCLVMTAAVADYRPVKLVASKIKKGEAVRSVELEATADILCEVKSLRINQVVAGFAAETGDPLPEARRKLGAKGLDVIFANDVSSSDAGFEADTNRIVCITSNGKAEEWPLMSKSDAGAKIAKMLEELNSERD